MHLRFFGKLSLRIPGTWPRVRANEWQPLGGVGWIPTRAECHASLRRASGLEDLGLIRVEWLRFEDRQCWVLMVLPDARSWCCEMLPIERLSQRRRQLDQNARRFAPCFEGSGLAPDADLHNVALPMKGQSRDTNHSN